MSKNNCEELFDTIQEIIRMIINNKSTFGIDEDALLYEAETLFEKILLDGGSDAEKHRLLDLFCKPKEEYAWRKLSELAENFLFMENDNNKNVDSTHSIAEDLHQKLRLRLENSDYTLMLEKLRRENDNKESTD